MKPKTEKSVLNDFLSLRFVFNKVKSESVNLAVESIENLTESKLIALYQTAAKLRVRKVLYHHPLEKLG